MDDEVPSAVEEETGPAAMAIFTHPQGAFRANSEHNRSSGRYQPIRKPVAWSRTWPGRYQKPRGQFSVSLHTQARL